MGMISPVEEEFHVGGNNAGMAPGPGPGQPRPGHGQSYVAPGQGGDRRSAEMMPPPPPPPMMVPLGAAAGVQFGGYMNVRRTRGGRGSRRVGAGGVGGLGNPGAVGIVPPGGEMSDPGEGLGGWQSGQGQSQSQQELGGYAGRAQEQGQGQFNPWGPPDGEGGARR